MVVFYLSLVLGLYVLYTAYVMPVLFPGPISLRYMLHLCIISFTTFETIFNYCACVMTPPGRPAELSTDMQSVFGSVSEIIDGRRITFINHTIEIKPGVYYRYCKYCNCVKPPRAYHCTISGKCVLEFDHFCPWIGQTVGRFNYRFFVSFIFFNFLCALYGVSMTMSTFLSLPVFVRQQPYDSANTFALVVVFTICAAGVLGVGGLSLWHGYLVFTNQTTVETYINSVEAREAAERGEVYRNPFDRGWRVNFKRVFGNNLHSSCSRTTTSIIWKVIVPSLREPPDPEYTLMPPKMFGSSSQQQQQSYEEEEAEAV